MVPLCDANGVAPSRSLVAKSSVYHLCFTAAYNPWERCSLEPSTQSAISTNYEKRHHERCGKRHRLRMSITSPRALSVRLQFLGHSCSSRVRSASSPLAL